MEGEEVWGTPRGRASEERRRDVAGIRDRECAGKAIVVYGDQEIWRHRGEL
jgi:hypothetical protein